MKTAAIILAAGQASRMGRVKALLPLAPQFSATAPTAAEAEQLLPLSALARLVALYREYAAAEVLIVTGCHAAAVEEAARRLQVRTVRNPRPEDGMLSSICTGLEALAPDCTHFFVHPVDVPLTRPLTVKAVLAAAGASLEAEAAAALRTGKECSVPVPERVLDHASGRAANQCRDQAPEQILHQVPHHRNKTDDTAPRGPVADGFPGRPQDVPAQAVILPVFAGQEGHPPLIPACHIPAILAHARAGGAGGLRGALALLPQYRVPVADVLMLEDMDTLTDHARLCALCACTEALLPEEAQALLQLCHVPEKGLRHAYAVGAVAGAFALALQQARATQGAGEDDGTGARVGASPDALLAEAGGLLHDICKGQPRHEQAGGRLLRALALPGAARLVEDHRDISLPPGAVISERELVYLADKFCRGGQFVPVQQRFHEKRELYAHDAAACAAISARLEHALCMEARLAEELRAGGVDSTPAELARQALEELSTQATSGLTTQEGGSRHA